MVIKNKFGRVVDVPDTHAKYLWNDPDVIEIISVSEEMLYSDDPGIQKIMKDIKGRFPNVGTDSDQMLEEIVAKPEAPSEEVAPTKGIANDEWTIDELIEYLMEIKYPVDSKTKKMAKAKLVELVNEEHIKWYNKEKKKNG